jgi:hypothetical protein
MKQFRKTDAGCGSVENYETQPPPSLLYYIFNSTQEVLLFKKNPLFGYIEPQ